MGKIITIHSYSKGAGKSRIATNMAVLLAQEGQRVGLLELNLRAPSLNLIFNLDEEKMYCFDDYLLQRCNVDDTVQEVTSSLPGDVKGKLFVIPCSTQPSNLTQILRSGVSPELVADGIQALDSALNLDNLIVDTSAGLDEQTLLLTAMSSAMAVIMVLDQKYYAGTGATIEISQRLEVPRIALFVNDVPSIYSMQQVRSEVEGTYKCPAAVLPHSDEMLAMAGRGIFVLRYPDHPLTVALKEAKNTLMA